MSSDNKQQGLDAATRDTELYAAGSAMAAWAALIYEKWGTCDLTEVVRELEQARREWVEITKAV